MTEPADLACRYFDAVPITVPDDPATLDTPVRADVLATPYQEAVTAATDAANWTVATKSEFNVRGAAVTCIGAIAKTDAAGIPVGQARYACLANVQTAGTVAIWATGAPDDEVFLHGGRRRQPDDPGLDLHAARLISSHHRLPGPRGLGRPAARCPGKVETPGWSGPGVSGEAMLVAGRGFEPLTFGL